MDLLTEFARSRNIPIPTRVVVGQVETDVIRLVATLDLAGLFPAMLGYLTEYTERDPFDPDLLVLVGQLDIALAEVTP